MTLRHQHYREPADYWRTRAFFRELFVFGDRLSGHWHVGEFDYWRWHWLENVVERLPDELSLWEAGDGRIGAVLLQGDPGVCHLHVHPQFRTREFLHKMVGAAERDSAAAVDDGQRSVWVWTIEGDSLLPGVLCERGFEIQPEGGHSVEHNGRRSLDGPIPSVPIRDGFTVRSMGGPEELPKRSLASWRAFHPGEPDEGCDPTGAWYRNVQRAPLYRRDLDMVGVAPNGDIASFAVCYFDDVSQTGVFVLDGTAIEYQRMGLAKAVMTEALRRLQWIGARTAYVSWYEAPAGALYRSVGFLDVSLGRVWVKRS
ncbi:GNAT family N-acetyltransferase [Candidatus Bipolaricaulota bacterium]|nr:GNAT family N-acetyltransferase [Candidatus Bipolaricaulota bacterium]